MKAILASFGSYGDIRPFLWLAKELQKDGHTVLFIANPRFAGMVREQDIEFMPAGTEEEYAAATVPAKVTGNRFWDQGEQIAASRRLFNEMFLKPSRPTYDAIAATATDDTVLFGHVYAYGARLAAEKFSLPYTNVCLSPYWLKEFTKPDSIGAWLRKAGAAASTRFIDGQLFTKPFNALRAEIGLGPMRKGSMQWMFDQTNLCLFPEFLGDFKLEAGVCASFAGFPLLAGDSGPLPPDAEAFLERHDKPIVFTPGSAAADTGRFFAAAIAALERLGKPGILLSRSTAGIPADLPEHVFRADFLPLELLLPRCGAIVHHGGIGTAAQAMAAGVPQLLCPRISEQRENARALERLGVAASLPPDKIDGVALASALARLTGDEAVLERCKSTAHKELIPREGTLAKLLSDCGKNQAT